MYKINEITNSALLGNSLKLLKKIPNNSIHAVVTDPPYGISFMNREWDSFSDKEYYKFSKLWSSEVKRVLKHGGYCVSFSSLNKYDIMTYAIRKNLNIRTMLMWLYGSDIPKGNNISVAIDDQLGKKDKRKVVCSNPHNRKNRNTELAKAYLQDSSKGKITKPYTEEAKKWDGWNTALKELFEPICLSQKEKEGTYSNNVLKHGVGGLNIDACRIPTNKQREKRKRWNEPAGNKLYDNVGTEESTIKFINKKRNTSLSQYAHIGRYPSNILIDRHMIKELDYQSGKHKSQRNIRKRVGAKEDGFIYAYGENEFVSRYDNVGGYNDYGGASRFYTKLKRFFYEGKVHKSYRNLGCEDLYWKKNEDGTCTNITYKKYKELDKDKRLKGNYIISLKPLNVMRWLIRLVCPKDGIVLDPFAGSGTTALACIIEGMNYILMEKRENMVKHIIPARIKFWKDPNNWNNLKEHPLLPSKKEGKNKNKWY